MNWYNKYIFKTTVSTIIVRNLSYVGTGTNLRCVIRKGKWLLHLRPGTNLYVLPEYLVFEDGRVPSAARRYVQEPTYAKYSPI